MTVSTQVSRNEYTGNGATTQYDFTFRILDKSHLLVQTLDTSESIVTLTLGTEYTVTGVNRYNGGKVVLTSALPAGYKISIERSTPVTQEASIRNQGGFFPEIHEDAFDKLTMLVQQAYGWWSGLSLRKPSWLANYYDALNNRIRNLRDPSQAQDAATKGYTDSADNGLQQQITSNFNHSLRVPDSNINQLPSAQDRAWKGLGFDGTGQPKLQDPAGTGLWGYVPAIGSFEQGSLLTQRFEVLLWESTDEYWRWDGVMPKVVLPGSTPDTAGGRGKGKWLDVTDATLRGDLADNDGFGLIGRCPDIATLRTLEPEYDGERVLVDKYDSAMSHTAGGGEFRYNASITDLNVKSKDLDVLVFRTNNGKYYERVGVQVITPYHAGAWGDWDPATKTGHDDTSALQKAINCAQVVPRFLKDSSGNDTTTLPGEMGKFRGWDASAGNIFHLTSPIEVQPLLVEADFEHSALYFHGTPYGASSSNPTILFSYVHEIQASNNQVSQQKLPKISAEYNAETPTYQVALGFVGRNSVTTGFRMHVKGGIIDGCWRAIVTAKNHMYYCKVSDTSFDHATDLLALLYVESDSGEENIFENCKFYQAENLVSIINGTWHFKNCSMVYPYNGNILRVRSGYVNLENCFLEGYQKMPGYMIYMDGGNYLSVLRMRNTHFAKIKSASGETLANPTPFYVGPGASIVGEGTTFDKVFQNNDVSDDIRLGAALHAGAGGRCTLTNTAVPTVSSGENNFKWSFPPALVPAGNVTKNGAIDNAWFTSTNSNMQQCGSFIGLAVFGQSGVVGAPSAFNASSRGWTENSIQVASIIHNSTGLIFNVGTGATSTQTYNAIIGVLPASDLLAYLPQVTYTSDAEFLLTMYYVKTTKQFTNDAIIDPTGIRVLSQPIAVSLPATADSNTLPNVAPYQEAVQFGGLKGSAQASHVLMCISSKTLGSTFTLKNASFVTI